ncbi:hypothetical protein [Paraglaciecola chathamensis]|jgi:hypothetical protein|uniref:Uncharacterized protein n=1 Tax=Paraglaciecola chathamensis TaxID=368405 RepID=A0A8H9M248_9ALTE|nr:hypothetical protein [Paraglaciecola oceanifecundans]AEE25507.1 hypothetical protein Glaag_4602 [Glaciecola sp. 4H-3-7+YE-5]GGZ78039.1 hypothetical protein GCM10011274_40230 [Paraglaciecola oceanifecundans]
MEINIPDAYEITFKDDSSETKLFDEDELRLFGAQWYGLTEDELNEPLSARPFENDRLKITPKYYNNQ